MLRDSGLRDCSARATVAGGLGPGCGTSGGGPAEWLETSESWAAGPVIGVRGDGGGEVDGAAGVTPDPRR